MRLHNKQKLNKYRVSYYYQDMGGSSPDVRPELEINANNEVEAAFFYNILTGDDLDSSYNDFLKLDYQTQTWGLTIIKLTDIPKVPIYYFDSRIKFLGE